MEARELSFELKSVYDVLPSPSNLCLWGLKEDPNCKLCGKPANLEHDLSSCRTALTEGRYTWRHNMVLKEVAAGLDKAQKTRRRNNSHSSSSYQLDPQNQGQVEDVRGS